MLVEFRVANHRSIREEQALSFEASGSPDDPVLRKVQGENKPALLPAVALYGANASGKTSVLRAFAFMCDAVAHSSRTWDPDGGVPRDPFAWGEWRRKPSEFVATVLVEGVRYEYGFVADDRRFVEEWLFAWPRGKKQTWFERDADAISVGEKLAGDTGAVQRATRPNALFLSTAAQLGLEQLAPLARWFRSTQFIRVGKHGSWSEARLATVLEGASGEAHALRRGFTQFLRAADLGISDLRVSEASALERGSAGGRVELRHGGDAAAWLPLSEESGGTQMLAACIPAITNALGLGAPLVIDELETSLHPHVSMQLISLFNAPGTNARNAQLLFTTHDTHLLGSTATHPLRRDQVWFTEKNKEGATTLYPLTDYSPRKDENLERGYLQGRYGAIPFLGELVAKG